MDQMDEIRQQVAERLGLPCGAFGKLAVCLFPQFVAPEAGFYEIAKILSALGIAPQPYCPWKEYDLCICFEDETRSLINVVEYINATSKTWCIDEATGLWEEISQVKTFINANCKDISKRRVAEVFRSVMGYCLDVDPRVFSGKMVRKSNLNAAHDGKVVMGPISQADWAGQSEDCVYNVHINNIEGDLVNDLRIPWFGHPSPLLYRKQRPVEKRFADTNTNVFLEPLSDHFSKEEVEKITEFCRAFGLDYGGIDCLRDRDSERFFIIDVNKTPAGPPVALPRERRAEAIRNLAVQFARGFLSNLTPVRGDCAVTHG